MFDIISEQDLANLYLTQNDVLFCDTETAGLYGKVTLFQCFKPDWTKVKIIKNPDLAKLNETLDNCTTVWFNASYDLAVLDIAFKHFEDLMILSRLTFTELDRCSLDNVLRYVLGHCPYQANDIVKSELQKSKWDGDLSEEQLTYASIDVLYMPKVFELVKEMRNSAVYKQDIETIRSCFLMQKNGFSLEVTKAENLKKKLEEELEEELKTLSINVNSPKQCREALNSLSSDEKTLIEIIGRLDKYGVLAQKILNTRKKLKSLSTIKKYLNQIDNNSRVYSKYSPTTVSGRLRSNNENLQQIPRNLKQLFGYENKDKILIYADYSQLELRTIAAILNVRNMVEAFKSNKDVHMSTAKKIFGANPTDNQRTLSKGYNFAMLYGASANGVRQMLAKMGIFITRERAERDKRAWLNVYPEIKRYHELCRKKANDNGKSRTALGRCYQSNSLTEQANILNQGSGAEVSKIAFNDMTKQGLKVVNFIHDSFFIESDADNYLKDMNTLANSMFLGWSKMAKVFKVKNVPMPIQVFCGYNWGEIERGEYIDTKRYDFEMEQKN